MSDHSLKAARDKAEHGLTVPKFEGILKDLYTRLLVPNPQEMDPELRNHYYFTQMFEPYLLLKAAIKAGDVGYINRALDIMSIIIFGSSSKNYAIVSIFLAYLTLTKRVASNEIRLRVVLAGNLLPRCSRAKWISRYSTGSDQQWDKKADRNLRLSRALTSRRVLTVGYNNNDSHCYTT